MVVRVRDLDLYGGTVEVPGFLTLKEDETDRAKAAVIYIQCQCAECTLIKPPKMLWSKAFRAFMDLLARQLQVTKGVEMFQLFERNQS